MTIRALAAAALAAALAGCAQDPARETQARDPAVVAELVSRYPASRERLSTTDGAIYAGNLDARIDGIGALLERADDPQLRGALANALLQRFRLRGRIADGEQALEEAERALGQAPDLADARLVQATALSAFHRFAESRVALERAAADGADPVLLTRLTRDLDVAEGRYEALAGEFASSREPSPDFYELAHRADLRVLQGDLGVASLHYRAAQDLFVDTSPAQLAWLYTQQGIALLRFGEVAEARRFFAAAHERLPQYYLAAEHLAESEFLLGNLDAALDLYRAVIAQTGNPEFEAALAKVEAARGERAAAEAARQRARAGFDALLERHRAATVQHAAEFLLEDRQALRALGLARENLAFRRDVGSAMLLVEAGLAAGDRSAACEGAAIVRASALQPPEWPALRTRVDGCLSLPR